MPTDPGPSLALRVAQMETLVGADPGGRGIAAMAAWCQEQQSLLRAAQALQQADRVALVTGFYVPQSQGCESDGLPGTLVLAETCLALGKHVVLVTDHHCAGDAQVALAACRDMRLRCGALTLVPYPTDQPDHSATLAEAKVLVFVETIGRSAQAPHVPRSHDGEDRSSTTGPLWELATTNTNASRHTGATPTTIGIGDGGNEIGMGSIPAEHQASAKAATRDSTDITITAGVSNWGAVALAAACALLTKSPHTLPPLQTIEHIHQKACGHLPDGLLGQRSGTVDGLAAAQHQRVFTALHALLS